MTPASATQVTVHWSPNEPVPDLRHAHLWLCDLDDRRWVSAADESLLSAAEHARAERLRTLELRRRFVARCVFVRRVLGGLLGVAPSKLEYRVGAFGKPELAHDIDAGLESKPLPRFNLSHSDNVLAVAVAFHKEVGVDVERVKTGLDFLGLGEGQLGAEEIARLRSLSEQERALAFYRSWTRHEAIAKATGRGIASRPSNQDRNDSLALTPHLAVSRLSEQRLSPWTWPRNEHKIPGACGDQPPAAEYAFECSLGGVFAIGSLALCFSNQPASALETALG